MKARLNNLKMQQPKEYCSHEPFLKKSLQQPRNDKGNSSNSTDDKHELYLTTKVSLKHTLTMRKRFTLRQIERRKRKGGRRGRKDSLVSFVNG